MEYAADLRRALMPDRQPVSGLAGVYVSRFSTAQWWELDEFRRSGPDWQDRIGAKIVSLAAVDADGNRLLATEADVFRMVAKGAAYTWDTIKAGAGVIGWVAGKLIQGFTRVNDVLQAIIDLAARIPGAPSWIADFGRGTRETNARIRQIGEGMSEWGANAIRGFGESAARVDAWMDGVEQRFNRRSRELESTIAAKPLESKLGGAMLKGSAESYSVVTKFQTQGVVSANDPVRKQLAVMEEVKRLLQSIDRGIANAPLLRAI